jgi:flavin-binding protein dodecin
MIDASCKADQDQVIGIRFMITCIFIIKPSIMSIVKVIELLAQSPVSWEDAAQKAIHEAAKTVHHIKSVYIKDHSVAVDENNKIIEYRITAKLSFEVNTPEKNLSPKG